MVQAKKKPEEKLSRKKNISTKLNTLRSNTAKKNPPLNRHVIYNNNKKRSRNIKKKPENVRDRIPWANRVFLVTHVKVWIININKNQNKKLWKCTQTHRCDKNNFVYTLGILH